MPVAAPTANAAATAFAASMSWVSLKYNRNKFRNLDYGSYMDKILLLLACLPVAAPRPLPDRAPAPWTFVVTTVAGELFARLRTTDNLLHHIYFTNSREISVYFFLPHLTCHHARACLTDRPKSNWIPSLSVKEMALRLQQTVIRCVCVCLI